MLAELNPVDIAESVQQLVHGKETPPTEAWRLEIERQEVQLSYPTQDKTGSREQVRPAREQS